MAKMTPSEAFVETLVAHGVKNVLVLNGHGGNVTPVDGIINQWKRYFDRDHPGCNIQYITYWDLIPQDLAYDVLDTDAVPGHARVPSTRPPAPAPRALSTSVNPPAPCASSVVRTCSGLAPAYMMSSNFMGPLPRSCGGADASTAAARPPW